MAEKEKMAFTNQQNATIFEGDMGPWVHGAPAGLFFSKMLGEGGNCCRICEDFQEVRAVLQALKGV